MTKQEAWNILREHIPANAGYDPCEWDEMAEYIQKYDEAYRIVREIVHEALLRDEQPGA